MLFSTLKEASFFTLNGAIITMSVVMRLALLLSPKSMAELQYLLIRRGVPSAALSIASMAASSKIV